MTDTLIDHINEMIGHAKADLAQLPQTPQGLMAIAKRTAVDCAVDAHRSLLQSKLDTLKLALEITEEYPEDLALGILDSAILHSGAMDNPLDSSRRNKIAGVVDALEGLSTRTGHRFHFYTQKYKRITS